MQVMTKQTKELLMNMYKAYQLNWPEVNEKKTTNTEVGLTIVVANIFNLSQSCRKLISKVLQPT